VLSSAFVRQTLLTRATYPSSSLLEPHLAPFLLSLGLLLVVVAAAGLMAAVAPVEMAVAVPSLPLPLPPRSFLLTQLQSSLPLPLPTQLMLLLALTRSLAPCGALYWGHSFVQHCSSGGMHCKRRDKG
jgi:hypothetical protein